MLIRGVAGLWEGLFEFGKGGCEPRIWTAERRCAGPPQGFRVTDNLWL